MAVDNFLSHLSKCGKRYGKVLVKNVVLIKDKPGYHFNCICDCGNEFKSPARDFFRWTKMEKACGSCNILAHSLSYNSWAAMHKRVDSDTEPHFSRYKARGITICPEWRDNFWQFLKDMGDRPKYLSLERKDNSKGYSKDNCCWATPEEQANNRG